MTKKSARPLMIQETKGFDNYTTLQYIINQIPQGINFKDVLMLGGMVYSLQATWKRPETETERNKRIQDEANLEFYKQLRKKQDIEDEFNQYVKLKKKFKNKSLKEIIAELEKANDNGK